MSNNSLEDRVSLITGGARGIGKSIAESLAKKGSKIIIMDPGYSINGNHDDKNIAERVSEEIRDKYAIETLAITKDISIEEEVKNSIEIIIKKFDKLDIVVNNAAIIRDGFIFKYSTEDWKKVIDTNLTGAFNIISETSKYMKEQSKSDNTYSYGRIINIISTAGIWGNYGQAAYASAKAGLIALTRVTALDLQRSNIKCNAIAPFAATRVTESIKPQNEAQQTYKKLALKIDAKYVGDLTSYLSSDDGAKYTGQIFGVRAKEVFLFNQSRPVFNFVRNETEDLHELKDNFSKYFDENLTPLETDLEAFSKDPIT
ncbi:MAG: putative short-chain type dehydrogenase/reductase [Alphaproteobacteria bacterium MarineAlpha9_Bin3]|nr:MAG: putative short-chain type dehydrogenase/reductase [Alphaproteobacteria bacterium MarineAlpha9_Bin3]|tara:strand:- start:5644 stop:6588 length:945 start_codon:yes stop_codon:yes gene_type:complete